MDLTKPNVCEAQANPHTETEEDRPDEEEHLSNFGSPKRGPTLSTSTSSFEALDPHDPNLSHLASLMFSHTSDYLQVSFLIIISRLIIIRFWCIELYAKFVEKISKISQTTAIGENY